MGKSVAHQGHPAQDENAPEQSPAQAEKERRNHASAHEFVVKRLEEKIRHEAAGRPGKRGQGWLRSGFPPAGRPRPGRWRAECRGEDAPGKLQIVDGGEDGAALAGPGAEDTGEVLGGHQVEAGEGLVEKKNVRALGEGAGEKNPLLLAAGELADRAFRQGRARVRPGRARPRSWSAALNRCQKRRPG